MCALLLLRYHNELTMVARRTRLAGGGVPGSGGAGSDGRPGGPALMHIHINPKWLLLAAALVLLALDRCN